MMFSTSRSALVFAFAVTAVVPFVTGCAEEEAEGREAEYPVGATVPPPMAPPGVVASGAIPVEGSEEVVVGADDSSTPDGRYEDTSPSALTDFRPALDSYGTWVDDPTYGTVWVPSPSVVGSDFTPYETAGHWAYDDDYVWVSDYDWGWAPFHYGRWVYGGGGLGWEWIPGRAYAGAWVSWRYGRDDWGYVGWAPLPPTWCWHRGVAVGLGYVPVAPYAFVTRGELFAPRIGSRVVVGERVGIVAAHTQPWVPSSGGGLAGRVPAHPGVGGPPPSVLRIPQSAIVQAPASGGLMQARAFARPGTGMSLASGGRAPGLAAGPGQRAPSAWANSSAGMSRSSAPAYGAAAPSHFGGRFGGGFVGSAVASSPSPTPYMTSARPYSAPYGGSPSSLRQGVGQTGGSVQAPTYSPSRNARSFSGFAGGGSTGGFHSGGAYSGGVQSGGGFRSSAASGGFHGSSPGGSAFHGGGGGGGGFHTGGTGGGFRGGGGGGRGGHH